MKYVLTLLFIISSSLSFAGILVEPQIGYVFSHSLKTTASLSANGSTTTMAVNGSGTALEFGGRFGYEFLGLSTGLNYSKGTSDKGSVLGAFVGYSAPILLRAWAAYNFSSKVNYGSIATEGSSIEAGIGYTALPLMSLNFIFRKFDLTTFKYSGTTYSTTNLNPTELMFGISVPLNL